MRFARNLPLAALALFGLPFLLGNRGCEPSAKPVVDASPDAGGAPPGRECSSAECGPAPLSPSMMCADGTVAGPGPCERPSRDGQCRWTFRECPPAGKDAGVGKDAGAVLGKDAGSVAGKDAGLVPANDAGVKAQPSGKTCGGIAALKCGAQEFCDMGTASGGQGCDGKIADAAGVCRTKPGVCTLDYRPVCGCDHKTYGNPCGANSEGMSVLHDGACTELDCKAIGGRAVDGIGPGPMCAAGEQNYTNIVYSSGNSGIEGTACCKKP